jgi:Ca2+-binding EF-hand superfamily protein
MHKYAIAAAIGLAFAVGAAQANEDKMQKVEAKFKAADKNGDGTLDKTEAAALPNVSKNFDAIDTDKDGTVSLEEILAARKGKKQQKKGGAQEQQPPQEQQQKQ